jgi:L-arabinokinase
MGHRLILEEIRQLAKAANKSMRTDPTGGYLANLDPDDYKRLFRPKLPEAMTGKAFLDAFDEHGDAATTVDPKATYQIQAACDHHVLENRRVHRFADFLAVGDEKAMRSAGHLMYASHKSYTDNARLGAPEADVVVDLVKTAESDGLYGARITGGGAGGTVAVLLRDDAKATAALDRLVADYAARTQVTPQLLDSSSAGAATTKSNVLP